MASCIITIEEIDNKKHILVDQLYETWQENKVNMEMFLKEYKGVIILHSC